MCIAALELHQHEATSCRFVAQLADKKIDSFAQSVIITTLVFFFLGNTD